MLFNLALHFVVTSAIILLNTCITSSSVKVLSLSLKVRVNANDFSVSDIW